MASLPVDPVNFFDTTAWTLLVENAYDKSVEFKRRSQPLFKQFFNKKVVSPSMDSDTYIFTLHNDFSTLSTTPLAETSTPAALAAPTPDRVSVTVAEYGAYSVSTIFLDKVAFTQPDAEKVALLARQQGDTVDKLALNVINGTTNIMRAASRASDNLIATTDGFKSQEVRRLVTQMDRSLNIPLGGGGQYVCVAHPDQLFDLRSESGANTWSQPQVYQNTGAIYSGEIGSYMGLRFVQSVRATIQTGAGAASANVYSAYVFADQAVAEVELQAPTTVVGPEVDALKRFRTLGWKMTWGASLYRPEALLRFKSGTSFA
jgi:N4-gp56 family major capsid protein